MAQASNGALPERGIRVGNVMLPSLDAIRTARSALCCIFLLCCAAAADADALASSDPVVRETAVLDPRRPLAGEQRLSTSGDLALALTGDLIIARPLTHGAHPRGFDAVLAILRDADAAFGNLETTIVDIRHFTGAPYPFDGDWANIAEPAVADDLKAMGYDMVGRANNHALDWGLEGMRETGDRLDAAGIVAAGTGESAALARAPHYFESAKGRIALISFATTFRPTTEAMPPEGVAPARAGLAALHLTLSVHVTADAMRALATASCAIYRRECGAAPATLTLDGRRYVADSRSFNAYDVDAEDWQAIARSIREARQHADLVLVAVHAHECDWDCEAAAGPLLPADMLKDVAHGAIDAGADVFAATGIHNLGPIEIYHGRPIFYGLANFFWSDIQEPVPHELFQANRSLLAATYEHPERATDYDLTARLNATSFANEHTFRSIIAEPHFAGGALREIRLYPIDLGYGDNLRTSGTPRLETRPDRIRATFAAIQARTAAYGLPRLDLRITKGIGTIGMTR